MPAELIFPTRPRVHTVHGRVGDIVGANGDYTATQITVTPAGTIASTNVQAALEELSNDITTYSDHGALNGLTDDDHPQYVLVNGTRAFSGVVSGVTPTSSANLTTKGYVDTALALKAPLASPALTGTPTAPTATAGTNTTQLATTAFIATAIANLVDSSPGTLDTLNELAAALGDDPNFATTIVNALALKAPLASPALTGTPTAPTAAPGTSTTQVATTAFVTAAVGSGSLTMEQIEDALAAGVIVSGYNILIEYNDAANTFTWHNAERICSDADAATITFNLSDDHTVANAGAWHETAVLTANRTLAVSNAGIGTNNAPGKRFQIKLNYDTTGGRTVTWFANITWVNGYVPATTPVGGGSDTFEFLVTSIDVYGVPSFSGWILSTERGVTASGTCAAGAAVPAPVSYWKFDESSGNAIDANSINDLTETGSAGAASGKVAGCRTGSVGVLFDKTNPTNLVEESDFTICGWFKMSDLSVGYSVIDASGTSGSLAMRYSLAFTQVTNRFKFSVKNTAGAVTVLESDNFGALSINTWYFVAASFNRTTKEMRLSVNNGTADTATLSGSPYTLTAGTKTFQFGTVLVSGTWSADEWGYWNSVLSADVLTSIYGPAGSGTTSPWTGSGPLTIDWSICEGDAITLVGAGTHTITHSKPIPLKSLLVGVTNSGGSGTLAWSGVTVDWGPGGAPLLPADGTTIYLLFECVTTSLILGRRWYGADGFNVVGSHLVGYGTAPTIAVGAGGGTGATASIVGTDVGGEITLNTGTTPSTGATAVTVTFHRAFGSAPFVSLSPANANAALLSGVTAVYITATTTTFVITTGSTGLTGSVTYKWNFGVIG